MNDHPLKVEHHRISQMENQLLPRIMKIGIFKLMGLRNQKRSTLMVITLKRGGKASQEVVLLLVSWVLV